MLMQDECIGMRHTLSTRDPDPVIPSLSVTNTTDLVVNCSVVKTDSISGVVVDEIVIESVLTVGRQMQCLSVVTDRISAMYGSFLLVG